MADAILAVPKAAPKICRKCQSEFAGKQCKVCANVRAAAYRSANPEKVRLATKRWQDSGKEKKCAKCGGKYYGRISYCQPCNKKYKAEYYQANRERLLADQKMRPRDCEKERIRYRKYYELNTSAIASRGATYYRENREKVLACKRAWADANAERFKEIRAAWVRENPDKVRVISQNRRARKRANGGKLSADIINKLLVLQRGKCACCGKPLGRKYHLDHIIPLIRGGRNEDSNVQLLTSRCNQQKHAKDPIDFMRERGFLL